jgi:hypothetical protein
MTTIISAPVRVYQGEPGSYDFTVEGQDWTGWTGTAKFKRAPQAVTRSDWYSDAVEPILEVAVDADAAGLIQVGWTAAQADLFPALPRLGLFRRAVCEVSMTDGTDVQKFQARVMVGTKV